jgi:hypothetical protein
MVGMHQDGTSYTISTLPETQHEKIALKLMMTKNGLTINNVAWIEQSIFATPGIILSLILGYKAT